MSALAVPRRRATLPAVGFARRNASWLLLVLLLAVGAALSPAFLTVNNLLNLTRQASVVGIAALGATFPVIARGVDVSVAAVLTASAVTATAVMAGSDANMSVAVGGALGLGLAIGIGQGLLVARGVHPFILTLGVATIVLGATQLATGGTSFGQPAPSFREIVNGRIGPVPILGIALFALTAVLAFVHHRTVFGRRITLYGANPRAAFLAGIPVERTVVAAYAISGLFAGAAGLAYLARSGPPSNFTGMGLEFEALAAIVLGGTTFAGGIGGVGGTLAGALVLAVAFNLVNLLGLPVNAQLIVRGAVIVIVAGAYAYARRADLSER